MSGGGRYVAHGYGNGDVCELTGKPRSAEVRFVCGVAGSDTLLASVREPASCTYVVTVATPRLCKHPEFTTAAPPAALITCRPLAPGEQPQRTAVGGGGSTCPGGAARQPDGTCAAAPAALAAAAAGAPATETTDPDEGTTATDEGASDAAYVETTGDEGGEGSGYEGSGTAAGEGGTAADAYSDEEQQQDEEAAAGGHEAGGAAVGGAAAGGGGDPPKDEL